MLLMQAQNASVSWEAQKKRWTVIIRIGGEVIRRPLALPHDAADDALSSMAVNTARDEGYELREDLVTIER